MAQRAAALAWLAIALAVGTAAREPPKAEDLRPKGAANREVTASGPPGPTKVADPRLHNAYQLHDQVISGAQPDEAAFRALEELGVKTIISVDGARPDVDTARKYGLRYVHLPHGYDGIPAGRVQELAKAVLELQGPIYMHCHHGKHRSPAAAAAACVAAGLIPPEQAKPVLQAAGTSPHYKGLFRAAETARPLDRKLLEELNVEFREAVEVPPMAEAMVALEHTHDHLKQIAAAGWRAPEKNPDLAPPHEALLLREHYSELLRTDEIREQPAEFQRQMKQAEASALALEQALQAWAAQGSRPPVPASITRAFAAVNQCCTDCHRQFRDVPEAAGGA